jgi:hypothetical protein
MSVFSRGCSFRHSVLGLGCAVFFSLCLSAGAQGKTLYVSHLGDDSDGATWATAFQTLQKALSAVSDDAGGHKIIVRPDTYVEANLYVEHRGAAGAYNELIGDTNGSLGSGTKGWVLIDSGDPNKGFKSYDWWSTMRATQQGWSKEHTDPTFSSIMWDRWRLSGLYATGADAGLFWDMTDRVEPFSVIVEDCVGIGRAFGGGVASCLSRPDEPITFRRCYLASLDWWGDTSGAYIRVENQAMPERPDAVLEDCVMVGPQCSLKASNYGFKTYTHIALDRCKLITLNFSQPVGTPTDGIIQCVEHGKYLSVDFNDCTLMGYRVFGVKVAKETAGEIKYTVKGATQAYLQFQQDAPSGMYRLNHWPADVYASIAPPIIKRDVPPAKKTAALSRDMCEVSPVVWKDRLCVMHCVRPATGGAKDDYFLSLRDAETGNEIAKFATGYGLACAFVNDGVFYAFASRFENENWNDVTMFKSSDLVTWESKRVIEQIPTEHLFNSSVCKDADGFAMAYETNDPDYPAFTIKFARSNDLANWTKVDGPVFGKKRYTACPCIRFANGFYYMEYLEHRTPRWFFETYIARSKDLKSWELAAANPMLTPDEIDEGVNASDVDIAELGGKTYLYYAVGDQLKWMNIKRLEIEGSASDYFESWFKNGAIPDNR